MGGTRNPPQGCPSHVRRPAPGPGPDAGSRQQGFDLRSAGPKHSLVGSSSDNRTAVQLRRSAEPGGPDLPAAADGSQCGVDALVPALGQETA